MDDSDDYILDDFILDDQALAVLDQEEKKFLNQSSLSASPILEEPASKRHKTISGWAPGIGANPAHQKDFEDLPEISLRGDGSYGVGTVTKTSSGPTIRPDLGQINHGPRATAAIPSGQFSVGGPTSSSNRALPQKPRPCISSLPNDINLRSRQIGQKEYGKTTLMEHSHDRNSPNPHQLQTQLLEMQRKLDELREENSKVQTALNQAIEVKQAKEGEVSVLRKTIEKTSHNHAAQLAQVKLEKEKADMKQVHMQKEMKDEMERLRTQFLFKQQELESSTRKPPASSRAKKSGRDFPSTPLPIPTTMRNWNGNASQMSTSRRIVDETPVRPSRPPPPIFKASPTKQAQKSPEKTKKPALPGFQNAFETSTPTRSPSKRSIKGKGRKEPAFEAVISSIPFAYTQLMPAPLSRFEVGSSMPHKDTSTLLMSINEPGPEETQHVEDDMDVAIPESDEDAGVEEETIEPINWKAELCRIVLTHSHPAVGQITFQFLLGLSQGVNDPHAYSESCAKVLGVMAASSRSDDYEGSLRTMCLAFLSILAELHESNQLLALVILMDLVTKLILSLHAFQKKLLLCCLSSKGNENISITDIIRKVILESLVPNSDHIHRDNLAAEVMNLLESLCFHPSSESIHQLGTLARQRNVIINLVHASKPPPFMERSTRLLALLSSHHELWEALLGVNNSTNPEEPTKDPVIERLCSHLIDTNRPSTDNSKIHILIYFAQLSIAHTDAHAVLVASSTLIPSLILYTSQLSTPLWEDDAQLNKSKEHLSSLIQTINQTVYLLYHLIYNTDPCLNLRYKLQNAQQRPFNCISHIFTVTFGRLSYCDPPSFVDTEERKQLESISEIAREILELVIDGPEGDSIWAAFQSEPDEEDEEEMEAQLLRN